MPFFSASKWICELWREIQSVLASLLLNSTLLETRLWSWGLVFSRVWVHVHVSTCNFPFHSQKAGKKNKIRSKKDIYWDFRLRQFLTCLVPSALFEKVPAALAWGCWRSSEQVNSTHSTDHYWSQRSASKLANRDAWNLHPETGCGVLMPASLNQMLVITQNSGELYFSVAVAFLPFTFFFASSF